MKSLEKRQIQLKIQSHGPNWCSNIFEILKTNGNISNFLFCLRVSFHHQTMFLIVCLLTSHLPSIFSIKLCFLSSYLYRICLTSCYFHGHLSTSFSCFSPQMKKHLHTHNEGHGKKLKPGNNKFSYCFKMLLLPLSRNARNFIWRL